MSDSWRSILERAADNLSIDLDQMAVPAFSHAQAAPLGRRLSPQLSFAESRELLARELQAFSAQSRPVQARAAASTALTVPVTAPPQKSQPARAPRKRTPWQNVLATLLSAILTGGLTAYFLLAQGEFGKEEVLALAAYADQAFRSAGEENGNAASNASASAAAAVSRPTEDALMERASYQLSHGDGQGGRAVFEVLAHHGSLRGAFALAETYDPGAIARHADWGLKSDVRLAREWYKKASELGSLSAYERLKGLDKRAASLQQRAAQL